MSDKQLIAYFYNLKELVAKTYLNKNPACTKGMQDWTGEEIKNFQDDLAELLNERLSERWFYTHLKPLENEKLPRIDMLNILARYVGCENWDDFRLKNELPSDEIARKSNGLSGNKILVAVIIGLLLLALFFIFFMKKSVQEAPISDYDFCFYDADSKEPISEIGEVTLLNEHESPLMYPTDTSGCIRIRTNASSLRFVIKAPYYKTDTIERKLVDENTSERIELRKDDYALMILYFATSAHLDWEKRRAQLDEMFDDEAIIFQISTSNTGMEMYNKTDFINKLTTPLESLGEIEIIETIYQKEKIITMRFMQH